MTTISETSVYIGEKGIIIDDEVKNMKSKAKKYRKNIIETNIITSEQNDKCTKYITISDELDRIYSPNPKDCNVYTLDKLIKIISKTISIDPLIFNAIREYNIVGKLLKFLNKDYVLYQPAITLTIFKLISQILDDNVTHQYIINSENVFF